MIECPADEFIPLPTKPVKSTTMSYMDIRNRARAACNAAVLLNAEGYTDPPADMEFVQALAHSALRRVADGGVAPTKEVHNAVSTPEGAMFVESLLTAYDMAVVRDAKRLRNYITNKLIIESENLDPRIRMRALELLGKISDVGLFTERTEITVNNRSTVELENSLREKLRNLMNVEEAEDARIIAPPLRSKDIIPKNVLTGL